MKQLTKPTKIRSPFASHGMENFLNDFFGGTTLSHYSDRMSVPSVNICENDTSHTIDVSAPGYGKGDFKINVDDGVLTIESDYENKTEESGDNYIRKEFSTGSFKRSFNIPENTNTDDIEAKYENGILSVIIPKVVKQMKEKKVIQIK